MFNKIMVALDGSKHANRALDIALDLGSQYQATLILFNVVRSYAVHPNFQHSGTKAAKKVYKKVGREVAEELLDAGIKRAREKGLDSVEKAIAEGNPSKAIVKFANSEGIDLIVMGTRGLTGLHELALGSVAHNVNSMAKCPVVTVK